MSALLSSSESGPKFRVAICGAGIGGLVLAITIGKYDPSIPIDLYEAHDSIDTAGVGITLWRQTHEIMIELGLFDEFKQIFTHNPDGSSSSYRRRSDIREGGYIWHHRISRGTIFHASSTHGSYPGKAPPSLVHSPFQEAAHGTTAAADVLIGADGVRSAVRKMLFEAASKDKHSNDETDLKQYIDATFTGMSIYRWLIPAETLKKESPENLSLGDMTLYHGKDKFCITYPIANGTIINVAAFITDPSLVGAHYEGHWVTEASRDDLVESFDNFEPDVRTLVKLCEKPSKWATHVVKPLPFCVRKNVALIGDACHAMTPHFGAGAGQAIEDAFVLGRLIAHPLTMLSCIPEALQIYEEIRLPSARSVASLSLSSGWLYVFAAPGYYDGTRREDNLDERGVSAYEKEGMEIVKQEILRRWDSMDELSGALQAWKDAESKLQALAN